MKELRNDAERAAFGEAMKGITHEALIFFHDHLRQVTPGAAPAVQVRNRKKQEAIADALIWFVDINARPQVYQVDSETGSFIPEPLAA